MLNSRLRVVFDAGTDEHGKVIKRSRTLTIGTQTTDEDAVQYSVAVGGLSVRPMIGVERVDTKELEA